ncbi:hypothetical protein LUD75_00085 [Epilithonimonas sp. JDS]|uniref:hypothetical protein n=1 Tax=Epilithonimonas sp. JDS TaxID=2902797 RepID=UPI001E45E51B|nr:hypothetical protein [Epilithonimonas sp. JDS]MCD9853085.1 hypothetical protein [Epilithonimonas sp. JDS]
MKKLLIVFSKFFLISAIIYCLVVILLYITDCPVLNTNIPKKKDRRGSFTARKLEEVKNEKQVDIMILGSSLAYRNYNIRVFQSKYYNSFNLGTSAQKPNMTYIIAKKYLLDTSPKLVVIDVNPYLLLMHDNFETTDVIINSSKSIYDFNLLTTAPSLIALNALIIKYTGLAEKYRLEKVKDSTSESGDQYLGNGFVGSKVIYDAAKKTSEINISNYKPSNIQMESFEKLLEFIKSNKINYILVLSPINEHYFRNTSKISVNQFRNLSKIYFAKYGNYIDSNDLEKYDKTEFMDFSHLNETGSKKFTNSIVPIIERKIKK